MNFNDYQDRIIEFDVGTSAQDNLSPGWLYYVLGIAGESGELMEKVKKLFRDHNGELSPERIEEITYEMGDILWYMARFADNLGIQFDYVAYKNIEKLASRKKRNTLHGNGDNR